MPSTPGTLNYPTTLDDTTSLIQAANNAATTLTMSALSTDTTLTVASTTGFPATGMLSVDNEIVSYTGTGRQWLVACG